MSCDEACIYVNEARNEMLRELLIALGDDLHARPETPRQVWEQALEKVRSLRTPDGHNRAIRESGWGDSMKCGCDDRPVDNKGEQEWICPTCGRVWEFREDELGVDEYGVVIIEDWWEPRDS